MFSTVFIGIMLLIRSPVTCTSGSKSHKLAVYHKSTSVPEDEGRNANASLQHQSLQLPSFIISQSKAQTNINTSNQRVRQGKCRDIHLLSRFCCDRTMGAPAKYDRVTNNQTRSICQSLENCLACTKTNSKAEKGKNAHKRLYKREAFKIYRKTELDDDESPMMLDTLTTFKHPRHVGSRPEAVQKYIFYAPFDDNEERIFTSKTRHSNESVKLTDVEFYQLMGLLGYNIFKASDGELINVDHLCQQLTGSGVAYADTIKRKLRCQHEEIKQGAVYVNTVKNGFVNPCRHSPFNERARKSLERSGSNEIDSNDESSEPCLTFTEQTAPQEKTIAKRPRPPLDENTNPLNIVSTDSSSCSHIVEIKLIRFEGCVPKSLLITRCQGNCQTSTDPIWDENTQTIVPADHCVCCSPFVMKFRTLTFHCPNAVEGVRLIRFGFPFQCGCRPCAFVPEHL